MRTKIHPSGYQNMQKFRPHLASYSSFSEAPPSGLTFRERISVAAVAKLELFQLQCRFCGFRTRFFLLWAVFWCHAPRIEKKTIGYSDATFYSESSEKFFFQKSSPRKNLARPRKSSARTFWLLNGNPYFVIYQVFSCSLQVISQVISGRFLLAVGRFRSFLARFRSFQVVSGRSAFQ